jgi:phosphatidylinositol alpha-mannosyltransferase
VRSHVEGLARALRARGLDVEILAPADRRVTEAHVLPVGRSVPIPDNGTIVPVALGPLAAFRTARALRSRDYDVVHVHEPVIPAVALTATMTSPAPLVGTFHMYASRPRWYRPFAPLCRRAVRRLDVRIAVSEMARWHVARTCPGEYRIIPNGIDVDAFESQPQRRTGSRIVFVGRADPRKGLPVLLEAFERLPAGTVLELVGVSTRELASLGASRGMVRAHGRVPDATRNRFLAEADVLCAPSLEGESFGMVIVEGMATGLPVVASDLPSYAAVLAEGAGLLVPPGEPAELVAALGTLLDDSEMRERFGETGRRAARRYDWSQVANEVLDAYEEARTRRARARSPARRRAGPPSERTKEVVT